MNRVAGKLNCSCGCNMNMNCLMPPYPCQVCRRAKAKIIAMQAEGKSDNQILDQFVQENGKDVLVVEPGRAGRGRSLCRSGFRPRAGAVGHPPLSAGLKRLTAAPPVERSHPRSHREGFSKARLMTLDRSCHSRRGRHDLFTLTIRAKDIPQPDPVSPTHHLEERKARIYENLRDLQFEYRVGKLSDEDYQRTKLTLQQELAVVLTEIDGILSKTTQAPIKRPKPNLNPRRALSSLRCKICESDEVLWRMWKGDVMRVFLWLLASASMLFGGAIEGVVTTGPPASRKPPSSLAWFSQPRAA